MRVCKGSSRMQRIAKWLAMIALAIASPQLAFALHETPADCAAMDGASGEDGAGGIACDQSCLLVGGSCSGCSAVAASQPTMDICSTTRTSAYAIEHPIQLAGIGEPPDPPPPRIFSR